MHVDTVGGRWPLSISDNITRYADNADQIKYIFGASGVRNSVLQSLDLKYKPIRTGLGLENEHPIGSNKNDHAILFVGSSVLSAYGWIFPTADGKLRVGVDIIYPNIDVSPKVLIKKFLNSADLEKFGWDLTGDYVVNSGTLSSVDYDPQLVFGNAIGVGDAANFATPTVGEGIRIYVEHGADLGKALGLAISAQSAAPLKRYEAMFKMLRSKLFGRSSAP